MYVIDLTTIDFGCSSPCSSEDLFGTRFAENDTCDAFEFLVVDDEGRVHWVQRPCLLEILHRVLVQLFVHKFELTNAQEELTKDAHHGLTG